MNLRTRLTLALRLLVDGERTLDQIADMAAAKVEARLIVDRDTVLAELEGDRDG